MKNISKTMLGAAFVAALSFSCSKDNGPAPEPGNDAEAQYVLGYRTTDFDQYLWQFPSLDNLMSGTINMSGVGIEQSGDVIPIANTFFAASTDDEGAVSYYLNSDGELTAGNKLFIESIYAYGVTDDDKVVLVGASWDGSSTQDEIMIYDPKTVSIANRKFDEFGLSDGYIQWPSSVSVSGDRLYISVFERSADWGIRHDKAWVKVYEYPSLNYLTTLEDTRTTAIGQYYTNTGMVRTQSGDVYTFSSNSVTTGYKPIASAHSGILRIKKGTSEFDASYFFDIESSELQGKVVAAYPAGGERVLVTYIPSELDADQGNYSYLNYGSFEFRTAVIDLAAKSITKVTGLPGIAGDNYYGLGSLYVEDGKAYKGFVSNSEARMYQIDLATGVAKPGALITGGSDIPAITKLTPTN